MTASVECTTVHADDSSVHFALYTDTKNCHQINGSLIFTLIVLAFSLPLAKGSWGSGSGLLGSLKCSSFRVWRAKWGRIITCISILAFSLSPSLTHSLIHSVAFDTASGPGEKVPKTFPRRISCSVSRRGICQTAINCPHTFTPCTMPSIQLQCQLM